MKNAKQSSTAQPKKGTPLAHGVGRRKEAIARVWLCRGKGDVIVNGKPLSDYFDTTITRLDAVTPLRVTELTSDFDIAVNVVGGGRAAQAGAVRLGIARALVRNNEALRVALRSHGLLTVDSRVKERKKYGQKAARRKFQFVKR